ncbi:SDR family oxidoreductase [Planctomicrobium sp. SH664]|uniref:SDR family oxidoreductase n=1 Tax=Planctomicrobium sp. SH664 TaxID=3448125 RepID=UPI003F5CA905
MILAGRSAIVTGGAIRIGREIGRALAREGVNVCVHYGTSATEASEAVQEFQQLGVSACAVQAELLQPVRAAAHVLEAATQQLGPITILINSAAIFEQGTLLSTDEENWDRHFTINLKAPFFLTQQMVKRLPPDTSAAVVNIVDWRGERPIPGQAAYTQAKAAFVAQTKLLAQELGPRIRVNGICPGPILPAPGETQQQFEALAERNPLKRTGAPEDIALGALYLLKADFVTGELLHITGGEEL